MDESPIRRCFAQRDDLHGQCDDLHAQCDDLPAQCRADPELVVRVRTRIATGFYDSPGVIAAVAEKLQMEYGEWSIS